jgi:hypothetical protein
MVECKTNTSPVAVRWQALGVVMAIIRKGKAMMPEMGFVWTSAFEKIHWRFTRFRDRIAIC